jgi:hypothetical protein
MNTEELIFYYTEIVVDWIQRYYFRDDYNISS